MSEDVHYKGKLTIIEKLDNETLEEQCKRLIGKELDSFYDSYTEMLLDEYYKEYIIHDDNLYTTDYQEVNPYNDMFVANKNEDGSIDFEVKYYNGGCGFSEAIEHALENLK